MRYIVSLLLLTVLFFSLSCRRGNAEFVTIALSDKFSTLDTLNSASPASAADERLRTLMFNTLVRKDESFEYVGELAKEIRTSDDGKVVTFVLRDGVKFHNGKEFTSADVKYTFDELFRNKGYKSGAFFDTVNKERVPHISSVEAPDSKTVVFTVGRPALRNQLLSNLVAIPIIPEGTSVQQGSQPVGSGPFRFQAFDQSQNIVELASNPDYFDGAPSVPKLRVKTVTDASSLQAELQTGGVDIAPLPSNLPPDTLRAMDGMPNLKVEQFEGSNVQYLIFNVASAPLNNPKIRQAIGYAIDREKIVRELLFDQARVAHSVLPPASKAYTAGTEYKYDPARAKQLIAEAGYKGEPIVFKFASGNSAVSQYSQVIQNALNDVGLVVQIETLEPSTIRTQLTQGQFQMYTGIWTGGNQDPIFLKDLFTTGRIPGEGVPCCNRGRYSNEEIDKMIDAAINEVDPEKARSMYKEAWAIISKDVPLLPLWYPANMVVANERIGNLKINPSGDWTFVKDITVTR